MNAARTSKGLTLLELIITISLFMILISIGVPSFFQTIEQQRSDTTIANIRRTYQFAREYAITNKRNVYFCGSDTLTECKRAWKKYTVVFIDTDGNQHPSPSEILHTTQLNLKKASMKTRGSSNKIHAVLTASGTAKYTGSMIYCPASGDADFANRVTWNRIGRIYTGIDKNGDGKVEDTNGRPIKCR